MTPQEWSRIEAMFASLCDLTPEAQKAALDNSDLPPPLRSQLETLLSFDGDIDLDACHRSVAEQAKALDAPLPAGTLIGAYRVIEPLGRGGMGSVYLAERADGRFDARVAIKVIASRESSDNRLLVRECQMLARFNHPGIARLLDAGESTDIGAWLVMEYVEGQSIRDAATEHAWSSSDIILRMATAADTVAAAHQRMILHQDLKPEHLVVDGTGNVRILDFGIAALLDPDGLGSTQTTASTGYTPRYAAPEQILNQPRTTATDVYALGLILFELLTDGDGPYRGDSRELAEMKLYSEARSLPEVGDLNPRQQRDLRAVLACALERHPEHRYAGPAALARDLRQVLSDRAVSVRSPHFLEAAWRWLHHNRLTAAALSLAVAAMVGGTTVSLGFAYIAEQERDSAVRQAKKATTVALFLENLFETASPGPETGPDFRARDLLMVGKQRIERELANEPQIAAELRLTMAISFLNLGLYEEAQSALEGIDEWLPTTRRGDQVVLQARLDNLAARHEMALQRLEDPSLVDARGNLRAAALLARATALINLGQSDAARGDAQEALQVADETDIGLRLALDARSALAAIAFADGNYDQALADFREIVSLNRRRHGDFHENTGMALHNLAGVVFMQGDAAEAATLYEQALAAKRAYYGVDNRSIAMTLRSLGLSYRRLARVEDAQTTLTEALAAYREWNGEDAALYQETAIQLAELLMLNQRDSEAAQLLGGLPELATSDAQSVQRIKCRLGELRESLRLPILTKDPCHGVEMPASLQAFSLFLAARRAMERQSGDAQERINEALTVASTVVPADPLLHQSLLSLRGQLQ